jgi:hypothetical protein
MRFSRRLFLIIVPVFILLFPPLGQHLAVAGSMPSNMEEHPASNGQGFTVWSIGGAWTCDGRPTSITQDGSGNLVFTNQMGGLSKGRFLNTDTVIATEWEGGLHGSVQDGGKTIRWANGTVWSRSLSGAGTPPPLPPGTGGSTTSSFDISGSWSGTYNNTRGESGAETLDIKEESNGVLKGLWGGAQIVNGRRSGDAVTWEARVEARDYKVSGTISRDGKRMTLKYSVIDPSRGNYSGVDELARTPTCPHFAYHL